MNFREKLESGYYTSYQSMWPDNNDPDYDEKRKDYSVKRMDLTAEFKTDLLKEYGIKDKTLGDRLFHLAWDRGHSSGPHEVTAEFEQLANLFEGYKLVKEE